MPLTYDEMSQVLMAFEEAHLPPGHRMRAMRIHQRVHTSLAPLVNDRAGEAFPIVVENYSASGIGIVHSENLPPGGIYVMTISRPVGMPLLVLMEVVYSTAQDDGRYRVGLYFRGIADLANPARVPSASLFATLKPHTPAARRERKTKRRRWHMLLAASAAIGAVVGLWAM